MGHNINTGLYINTIQTSGRLHLHEREYIAQLDPSPAALVHVLFDGVRHDSQKFTVSESNCCDFIYCVGVGYQLEAERK